MLGGWGAGRKVMAELEFSTKRRARKKELEAFTVNFISSNNFVIRFAIDVELSSSTRASRSRDSGNFICDRYDRKTECLENDGAQAQISIYRKTRADHRVGRASNATGRVFISSIRNGRDLLSNLVTEKIGNFRYLLRKLTPIER